MPILKEEGAKGEDPAEASPLHADTDGLSAALHGGSPSLPFHRHSERIWFLAPASVVEMIVPSE